MPDQIDYTELNSAVKRWKDNTFRDVKSRYMHYVNSPNRSGDGLDSLKSREHQSFGMTDRISYSFNRYLVFLHKGVGRGRPIGSSKVKPKPWLNPVLDTEVPKLADIVVGLMADQAVKAIQIK